MNVMIDKFDKLLTAVDPTIVDVEVTETILKCSNSNNGPNQLKKKIMVI